MSSSSSDISHLPEPTSAAAVRHRQSLVDRLETLTAADQKLARLRRQQQGRLAPGGPNDTDEMERALGTLIEQTEQALKKVSRAERELNEVNERQRAIADVVERNKDDLEHLTSGNRDLRSSAQRLSLIQVHIKITYG